MANMFEEAHEIVSDGLTGVKKLPRHTKFWRTLFLFLMIGFAFLFPWVFLIIQGLSIIAMFVIFVEELLNDDTWWICSYFVLGWLVIGIISFCAGIWEVWTWMSPTANKGKKNIGGIINRFNNWVDNFEIKWKK
jgi:hypothetical protein